MLSVECLGDDGSGHLVLRTFERVKSRARPAAAGRERQLQAFISSRTLAGQVRAGSINSRTRASASPISDVGPAPTSAAMVAAAASDAVAATVSPAR